MTLRENRIADEVEKTLWAFDHDPVLEPNPYLLTRIQSALRENPWPQARRMGARIRPGVAFMVLLIVLNLVTLSRSLTIRLHETLQQQLIRQLQTELHIEKAETIF